MPKRISQFIIVLILCAGACWGQPSILTTSPLTNGGVGSPYNFQMTATGGSPPYTWSLIAGSLPNGLLLSTAGIISGTPLTMGPSTFTIFVKDLDGSSTSQQFNLVISLPPPPFTINTTSPLPPGQFGIQYAQTLAVAGAPGPYTWSVVSGVLPGGLTLSLVGGMLSGTPTVSGTWNFTVQVVGGGVSQSGPPTAIQVFSLTINLSPLAIASNPTLAPSTAGLGYARTLQAAGGLPPYTWTIVSGAPPPGVTMNTAGMFSGTPTTAGLYSFTVQVVDNSAVPNTAIASLHALINPPLTFQTTSPLPAGTVGVAYLFQGTGFGGTPPVSTLITGTLPPGLTLPANGFLLSGTPTTAGNYSFAIQANDSAGASASRMFIIAINQTLAIATTSPLPGGTASVAYSQTLSSTGGAAPVIWSIAGGSLPSGLTLTGAGVLSGTPAVATGSIFTVQASDAAGATVSKQLVLNIAAPLAISAAPLPGGNVGFNYVHTLVATGGRLPYTWSLISGALPSGVTLASAGTLFGIPSAAGGFNFTIQVSDSSQVTTSSALSITVAPQLKITSSSALPGGTMASPYNRMLTASGGTPPYLWSVSGGALPAGLSLNASSGTINGVPGAAGSFSFTAQVKDSAGIAASSYISLAVSSRPAIGTASTLPPGVTATAYLQNLSASGGTPPYQWSLQAGTLPAGLTLDPSSGAIGGKPSAPGHASFTVQLQDSAGISVAKPFDITVTQTLSVAPTTLLFRTPLAPQSVQVSCSTVGAPLSISTSAPWLTASPAHAASPAAISVTADPSGLAAGTYQGSVSISTGDLSQTVSVSLTVVAAAAPAGSQASPATLNFVFALGADSSSQSVTVTGAAYTATVSNGAGWLTVSPPGSALAVTANPAAMAAGTYSGRILLDDGSTEASVAVTMSISTASQNLVLSQTGITFYTVAGSTGSQSRSFGVLNSGQGSMNWTATSSTLSGGSSWLSATPSSGVSDAVTQATSLDARVDPTGLAAGEYYGQIAVAAPSAGNSPRLVSIVLNVLPADKSPGAQVYPSGLLFTGVAHGANPDARTVTLTNVAATAAAYTSANLTDDGANWITLTPASGFVPGSTSSNLAVQPNIAGLGPGVWQGFITLRFGDGSVRIVNVALVLRSGSPAGSPKEHLAAGCTPSKLVPLFTSLGSSFSVPASWPNALEMAIVNDCGDPFTDGSVVTTFSNGDPPLALTALREGNWGGTWTPRAVSASGVLLTGQSRNAGGDLQGVAHITGGVLSNTNPPVISPGGIVSSASFATEAPLAPGSIIAIFGSHLADGAIAAQALPLPSQLGATQVIIGGQSMPLFFVSDSQINAMLPYEIAVNRPYQVIVQRGTSATIPETITLAAAGPAVFTKDQTGIGPGLVFDARFVSNDPANPATAGDAIVIYTTGLGDVNPPIPAGVPAPLDALSPTASPATVTIGGVDAPQVLFAGLAPGFTGLYQVNVVVPAGVAPGDAVPIIITVADRPGPPVTLAVTGSPASASGASVRRLR
jgi:uncharacterized protein (TIGR03437 family)